MNELSDGALDSNRAEVYAAIMKLVRGGANSVPSVKALDLYNAAIGLLTGKHVLETSEDVRRREISPEERQQALDKLDRMLDDGK